GPQFSDNGVRAPAMRREGDGDLRGIGVGGRADAGGGQQDYKDVERSDMARGRQELHGQRGRGLWPCAGGRGVAGAPLRDGGPSAWPRLPCGSLPAPAVLRGPLRPRSVPAVPRAAAASVPRRLVSAHSGLSIPLAPGLAWSVLAAGAALR